MRKPKILNKYNLKPKDIQKATINRSKLYLEDQFEGRVKEYFESVEKM